MKKSVWIIIGLIVILGAILYLKKVKSQETVQTILPEEVGEEIHTIRETLFPKEVLDYGLEICEITKDKAIQNNNIAANVQLYAIDEKVNLWMGIVLRSKNPTEKTRSGEIKIANTDMRNDYFFNESGEILKSRLVKVKEITGGQYELYLTLDRPWLPGEERTFVWMSYDERFKFLRKKSADEYSLQLRNDLGVEGIQSLCLVLPPHLKIKQQSEDSTIHEKVGRWDIYTWQKHVYPNQSQIVDLVLEYHQ